MKVILTARGACSDELVKGSFSQAPPASATPERRVYQKSLDKKEMMREKRAT